MKGIFFSSGCWHPECLPTWKHLSSSLFQGSRTEQPLKNNTMVVQTEPPRDRHMFYFSYDPPGQRLEGDMSTVILCGDRLHCTKQPDSFQDKQVLPGPEKNHSRGLSISPGTDMDNTDHSPLQPSLRAAMPCEDRQTGICCDWFPLT